MNQSSPIKLAKSLEIRPEKCNKALIIRPEKCDLNEENTLDSLWDRYLGMTAAMTQVPVPTAIVRINIDILKTKRAEYVDNESPVNPDEILHSLRAKSSIRLEQQKTFFMLQQKDKKKKD